MNRHFQPKTGHFSCYHCPNGKFQDSMGKTSCDECKECPKGFFASTGGIQHKNASYCSCVACDEGKFTPAGHTTCYDCPIGRFQHEKGHYSCYYCPPGKYANGSASLCTQCEYEKYQPLEAQDSCKWCPKGKFQHRAGSKECSGKLWL